MPATLSAVRETTARHHQFLATFEAAHDAARLPSIVAQHQSHFATKLATHGALLFRGFDVDNPRTLEEFAVATGATLFADNGEHPRDSHSGRVYATVFYPSEQRLLWHNENSFNHQWPTRIWFACAAKADSGGECLLVDSTEVYRRLDPAVRRRFVERGVMYVRNYGRGFGLDWRTVFGVTEPRQAEEACRRAGIAWEWHGDRLRTKAVRPAAIAHPITGVMSWFNQAQHWHLACLPEDARTALRAAFAETDLPRQCYYGDGSPIDDGVMQHIVDVYASLEVSVLLEPGDVLMLDNVLAAHGRAPYRGKRKILVALGDMAEFAPLEAYA